MYRRTWVVVAVVLAASTANADRHWRARVSFDDTMKHEGGSGGEKVTTTREAHASFEVQLTTTDDEVTGTAWGWSTVDKVFGASGAMKEEMIVVNDGHTSVIRFEGNIDPTQLGLECEYNQVIWRCRTGLTFKGHDTYLSDGKVVKTVPQQKAEPALFQKNGKGASATKGGEQFTFSSDVQAKDSHQKVTIAIDPLEKTGYEAVFVMDPGYETFVPEGAPPDKPAKKGNSLDLHIELRDAKTHKRSATQFAATLALDSSKLPGTCMNFPAVGESAPDEPDLFFEGGDEKTKTFAMGQGGGKVTIRSRDYGGFATLTAHVKVADGTELDVRDADGNAVVNVPKDDNKNHIADIWEKSEHLSGSTQPDADDESLPSGMAAKGDGYTLFEEYRGFVQADPKGPIVIRAGSKPKAVHGRLHPNDRDLILGLRLAPEDEAPVKRGLAIFSSALRVKLAYVADPRHLAPMDHDYSATYPRRADHRGDGHPELFGKPQAAVWLETTEIPPKFGDPGVALSWHPDGDPKPLGSPKEVMMVIVSRVNADDTVDGMICYLDPDCHLTNAAALARQGQWNAGLAGKLDANQRRLKVKQARNIRKRLDDEMITFTVFHELAHTFGAYHHDAGDADGDKACPMRYWNAGDDWDAMIDFLDGAWDLTTPHKGDGAAWEYCAENLPQMRLRDFP